MTEKTRAHSARPSARRVLRRASGIRIRSWGDRGLAHGLAVAVSLACLLPGAPMDCAAAWVRPLEGSGNFRSMIDMYNQVRADSSCDVILLFSVANRELDFDSGQGVLRGDLQVEAELAGDDGIVVRRERHVQLRTANWDEADSPTLFQVFTLVLPRVTAKSGVLTCSLEDLHRNRKGLLNLVKKRAARSETVGDWEGPPAESTGGLNVGDPIFLSEAPLALWAQQASVQVDPDSSPLFSYLHPNRRYGLEQDRLQVFFTVEGPPENPAAAAAAAGLFVQVLAKDLDFALRDTITLNDTCLETLARDGRAGLYYELDVNQLPAGPYQLSCAPANGEGRGWVAEFDVIWNLEALNRHGDDLEGEGRTVLLGDQLQDFLKAGQAEREIMLEEFWSKLDPDPETPVNEAYLEFRRRVSYVNQRLGGFGRLGAKDARGEVYLLLGSPNEVQVENMPLNTLDLEDATVKVYDKYAPDRAGTEAKGARPGGTQGRAGSESEGSHGGIPLQQSYESRRDLASKQRRVGRGNAFELWNYNHIGHQLFPNKYGGGSLGMRFLFVDRTGTGNYVLESTNAWNPGN